MSSPIPYEISGLSNRTIRVLTGAQTIYAYEAENPNFYPVTIKFYDKVSTTVNPAVDAPSHKITIPAADLNGFGIATDDNVNGGAGWAFATAISARCTPIDNNIDTTSPATSPFLQIQTDQVIGAGGGSGDVVGPASATDGHVALFNGATGKLLKDTGVVISGTNTGDQTITLTGDVTGNGTGSFTTVVANIPSGATAAGNIVATAIAAPSTPSAGAGKIYVDLTSKNLSVKDDAGIVKHGVQTKAANTNQFVTAIADDGTVSQARPAASDVSGLATVATSGSASDLGSGTLPSGRLPALSGDVVSSAGSNVTTLSNIPSGAPMAGNIQATAISAPITPNTGVGAIYVDNLSKNLAVKDDNGVIKHGVQTKAAVANSFVTAIDDAGSVTVARPSFTDVAGTLNSGQFPALTGDVTASAGSTVTTVSPTFAGVTGINTVGTITTGTWNATALAASKVPSLDAITAPAADVSANSHKVTNLADPTSNLDATNKQYVDNVAAAGTPHPAVRVATTATGTLATAYENGDTVDGVVLATNDRILLKDQTTATDNGIYTVNASGAPTRAADANTGAGISGSVFVTAGTANAGKTYTCTTSQPITLGSTSIAYTVTGTSTVYTAGNGLSLTSSSFAAVGTTNRISVGGSIDISGSYVGQSSITTLGTVGTGTWQGTTVAGQYGGTGVVNTGKTITVSTNATIGGTNTGDVTTSGQNYLTLAGQAITANAVDLSGTNVTGILATARHPALTGDVTTPSGSVTTTVVNLPTGVTVAGNLLSTAIVAPATPAAGKGRIYEDSTSKNLCIKDDAGVVKHGIQTLAQSGSTFIVGINDDGSAVTDIPQISDLSDAGNFAPSAFTDTTNLTNITSGTLAIARLGATRTHVAEASTITIPIGDGKDYDSTASGTLTSISLSGTASSLYIHAARLRLLVTNAPQTISFSQACRRVGTVGTVTSVTFNNGNHELCWLSQPSGAAGALEYWLYDSGDDIRQTFDGGVGGTTLQSGVRQLSQTGTMSAPRTVILAAASSFPNGTGFWITDESGTVSSGNPITLQRAGSDTLNTGTTLSLGYANLNVFVVSNGSNKWTVNPASAGVGSGTVTNTAGNLTSNSVVLGAGGADAKVVAGVTTDGTAQLTLGVANTSTGKVNFKNTGSGTLTLSPLVTGALGSNVLTLPTQTDTLATLSDITTNVDAIVTGSGFWHSSSGSLDGASVAGTGSGNVVRASSPTVTGLALAAGSTTVAPINLVSGTNLTTPTAGAIEYDGKVHYSTHAVNERGVLPSVQWIGLTATYTLVSNTTAQPLFNTSTNGAVTLAANTTYRFNCHFNISGLNATNNSVSFGFGGTAAITSAEYSFFGIKTAVGTPTTTPNTGMVITATATSLTAVNTQTNACVRLDGIIRITTTGTLIPQVTQNNNGAAAIVGVNSWFEIWPIGSDSTTASGNWS